MSLESEIKDLQKEVKRLQEVVADSIRMIEELKRGVGANYNIHIKLQEDTNYFFAEYFNIGKK